MDSLLGLKLKNDVTTAYGLTIIPALTIMEERHLALLAKHGITPDSLVYVEHSRDSKLRRESGAGKQDAAVRQAVKASKALFAKMQETRKIPVMELRDEVLPIVQQAAEAPDVFGLFESIKAKDDYTYEHNIGVGVLATLIGKWMNLNETELSVLAMAATLHDVGKVRIPTEILNKPGKLTSEEYAIVKQHTVIGYEMLKGATGLNGRVALVALQHHERSDGGGYPLGLTGEQIDPLSRIVAVADVFHAMSSRRPYHEPLPFYDTLNQMRQGKFGFFDPQIVSIFLENMVGRMVGRKVVLTDGRSGEVVYLNPHSLERPLVRLEDGFIDLSKVIDVHILRVSI
ncbi:HD-GYP domain-containing protein [Paenibacillus methanolicus]|uniref:HD-GYP domain-containing protein (C-di-GMP phosphodiesterase class II) n=1 Tax=Paenibacillus methanolicus TaxID=582686 RepID=A0A5S5BXL8_9BACL|nr:HD-GYP domain-containing protein [Paenibacillus methanolicus]TYP71777.1 HD-GYP domain-containing protein (c-di-GMP phosphodiesterase class II) [Paenibacillus methanolicus]